MEIYRDRAVGVFPLSTGNGTGFALTLEHAALLNPCPVDTPSRLSDSHISHSHWRRMVVSDASRTSLRPKTYEKMSLLC